MKRPTFLANKYFHKRPNVSRRGVRNVHVATLEWLEPRCVLSADGMDAAWLESLEPAEHEIHSLPAVVVNTADSPAESLSSVSEAMLPLSETFRLHSNAGAAHTIYLDFDGHVTSGTYWNSVYNGGQDFVTAAYDFDGNTSSFSNSELDRIQQIWRRVAEDFSPFNVNVTTEDPGAANLINSGGGDANWGTRVVIGGSSSDWYGNSAGGVAMLRSFTLSSDTPAFVFEAQLANGAEKYTAEAISHEAGHTLGLYHDGRTSPSESYYQGHGSGDTGWAPIMGNSYYKSLTQWSKGEYANASRREDDLAIITGNNGFGYRADDHGGSSGSASLLSIASNAVSDSGIIERNTDFDVFSFTVGAGQIELDINPLAEGANLDILAELYDSSGTLVASSNPSSLLSASISVNVSAGEYFLHITGTGKGDPLSTGYSDYGSLGQYWITGTVTTTTVSYDTISIAAGSAEKDEGESGNTAYTFIVSRSGDTDSSTAVNYYVTSSQANAADFSGGLPNGTITFAAGQSAATITIWVIGDTLVEDNEQFTVTISVDPQSTTQIDTASANGTILNDDIGALPGISVTPTSGLTTHESGTTASFSVVLQSVPTAAVTILVSSSDTTEGTVNKSALVFDASNWNTAQVVTVTGQDDLLLDGDILYTIDLSVTSGSAPEYTLFDPAGVQISNQNDDIAATPGIDVSPIIGLATHESGQATSFSVVLQSVPTGTVTILVTSSDTTEGTVNKSSLVFNASNWDTAQTVVVTGQDDSVRDGNILYTIGLAVTSDSAQEYTSINPTDVQVTNRDDEKRGNGVGQNNGHGKDKKNNTTPAPLTDSATQSNSLLSTPPIAIANSPDFENNDFTDRNENTMIATIDDLFAQIDNLLDRTDFLDQVDLLELAELSE